MNKTARAIFILLLITFAQSPAFGSSDITSLEFDLDGDGRPERLRLDKGSALSLSIRHGERVRWRGVPASWQPWKLTVADVDGDGRSEIIVGVHKATRFFPKPHNCLFIYGWEGERAYPKWLGSSLSKPFVDFAFIKRGGGDELVAIEIKRDGKLCVAAYSWNGFGFTLDWQSGDWRQARLLEATSAGIIVEADGRRVRLASDEMRERR